MLRAQKSTQLSRADFISDISTAEVPTGQRGEDPCLDQPPSLLPQQDPMKMGPGLNQFLLLHLKRGDGELGLALLPLPAPLLSIQYCHLQN